MHSLPRLLLSVIAVPALIVTSLTISSVSAHAVPASANLKLLHSGEILFGTDASYPPMESIDSNTNKIIGADIGLGKAIAKKLGLKAVFQNITFGDLLEDIDVRHSIDGAISSMNNTPSRRKFCPKGLSKSKCYISFVNYLKAVEAIVVDKSSSLHANNYSQICGWTISVESSTTEEAGLKAANGKCNNKIQISEFPQDTLAFEDFASRHVEAYTTDYPVAAKYVKNHSTEWRLAGNVIKTGEFYGIATAKNNPALHNAIAKAFSEIVKSGQYLRILKKWGVSGGAIK